MKQREEAIEVAISCGTGEHRYGAAMRPPGSFTVPKGFLRIEQPGAGEDRAARHGVVVYGEPLLVKDLRAFELVVLADAKGHEDAAEMAASELKEYATEAVALHAEDPDSFEHAVRAAVQRMVPFELHLGNAESLPGMVLHRLKALCDAQEMKGR